MERGGSGGRRPPPPQRRTTLLYLGTTSGILALRRRGAEWRPLHCGLAGQPVPALAVAPDQIETVYAASGDTVYQSPDGGTHWRPIGQPRPGAEVQALLVGSRQSGRLLVGLRPLGVAIGGQQGARWQVATLPPLDAGAVTTLQAAPGEEASIYAVAAGRLLVSTDGGQQWQILDSLPPPITSLALHPDSAATLYAGGPGGLLRTRNGGRTWQRLLGQPVTALLVHPTRPRTIIAALPDGLTQSPNTGANWHPMPSSQVDPDDPVVALVGHAPGEVVLALTAHGLMLQLLDGQWQPPLMGPAPPILAAAITSGELATWPGVPKRSQTRRRRPARREAGQSDTAEQPSAPAPPRRPSGGRPSSRRQP